MIDSVSLSPAVSTLTRCVRCGLPLVTPTVSIPLARHLYLLQQCACVSRPYSMLWNVGCFASSAAYADWVRQWGRFGAPVGMAGMPTWYTSPCPMCQASACDTAELLCPKYLLRVTHCDCRRGHTAVIVVSTPVLAPDARARMILTLSQLGRVLDDPAFRTPH